MNKKKYNQLLSEIILLPFIHADFDTEDLIQNYVSAYHALVQHERVEHISSKNNRERKFVFAKKQLIKQAFTDYRWEHLDDVQMMLEMFYPGQKLNDMCNGFEYGIGKFYLEHISNISRVFLTFRDGMISLRTWSKESDPFLSDYDDFNKIELWNHLSRTAMSDLFIAACFVNFNIKETNMLYGTPNLVFLADMPLMKLLKKGVAETHMHTNAGISYQDLWKYYTSLHNIADNSEDGKIWYCKIFRLLSALYIESVPEENFGNYLCGSDTSNIACKLLIKYIDNKKYDFYPSKIEIEKIISRVKRQFKLSPENLLHDVLYDTVYRKYSGMGTSSEIIWLYRILSFLKVQYDPVLCEGFIRYIRFKNEFFQSKVQQTKIGGLDFFQRFYNEATEFPRVDNLTEDAALFQKFYAIFTEQCRTGNLKVLEMKIVPKIFSSSHANLLSKDVIKMKILRQIQQIIKAYSEYITQTVLRWNKNNVPNFPKIGFIYHFIKTNHSDNFNGTSCVMYQKPKTSECFDYSNMREACIRFLEALTELLEEYPILTDYIIGIDAASIENATEPWVFAPVFKKARSNERIVPYSVKKPGFIQNIGFTYHVGEDFRHIVSGLRHIDEVLTHFKYRSGDRLGHAIALGVDIDTWCSNKNIITMPIMEYLEDLLWMWQNINASKHSKTPENLEFKIMETARKIYHEQVQQMNVYMLWRVYQSKFDLLSDSARKSLLSSNNRCSLSNGKITSDNNITNKLLCSHFCPCFYELYNKPIFVQITKEDIKFYKELQSQLLNKVEQMGVYIETNPSSNMIIGDIPSIFDHPILRLNNRGINIENLSESCAMVSINSDDPVVFSTFVENEISYIYYALLNAGCKREEVLKWIDKIRLQGIESSFIKHNKPCNEMLKDFSDILKF